VRFRYPATYTQLEDGTWVAAVEGITLPKPGDALILCRRDGSYRRDRIGRVLFRAGDMWVCSLASQTPKSPQICQ